MRYNNDSPTKIIYDGTYGKIVSSRNVTLIELVQSNASSSKVNGTDEGSKSLVDLENVYDGITSFEPTGSNSVEGDDNSVHQYIIG